MKRFTLCWLVLALTLLAGCFGGNTTNEAPSAAPAASPTAAAPAGDAASALADGAYFAISDTYADGWKDFIALSVEGGRIVSATWDSLPENGSKLKSTLAAEGSYSMKSGGAQREWNEQSQLFTQALIDAQGLPTTELDKDGKTDAVSGVTISIDKVSRLYEQALSQGPLPRGELQDGLFYAQAQQYDNSGYAESIALYISGGRIVWVNWNGAKKDSDETKKSLGDSYGMKAASSVGTEWYQQAAEFEKYVIEHQGVAELAVNSEGKTDAISGCTVNVGSARTLTEQILTQAQAAG